MAAAGPAGMEEGDVRVQRFCGFRENEGEESEDGAVVVVFACYLIVLHHRVDGDSLDSPAADLICGV